MLGLKIVKLRGLSREVRGELFFCEFMVLILVLEKVFMVKVKVDWEEIKKSIAGLVCGK